MHPTQRQAKNFNQERRIEELERQMKELKEQLDFKFERMNMRLRKAARKQSILLKMVRMTGNGWHTHIS